MTPVRIIGIGSPHAGDRAGWHATEARRRGGLAERFRAGLVSIEHCAAPVHLYALVAGCRLAILIDAVASDARRPLSLDPAMLCRAPERHSVHGVGVGEMLQLLRALAASPPRILLFGLPVGKGGHEGAGEARLQCLLPELEWRVERAIAGWLGPAGTESAWPTRVPDPQIRYIKNKEKIED
jgi:Ni,Fe-hydrogenase maturation factor